MVDDNDARNAVRSLMERFELINSQRLGLAYVLAKKDRDAYETLLAETEDAIEKVIRPLMEADAEHQQVLATLSDSEANWPAALCICSAHPSDMSTVASGGQRPRKAFKKRNSQ